jgi:hypothetical protein
MGRYAPGQTEAVALADMRRELEALEARFPASSAGLAGDTTPCLTNGSISSIFSI